MPGPGHLRELRGPLGLIGIDQRKPQRLADAFGAYAEAGVSSLRYQLSLDHADLTALVAMGPSARHLPRESLAARVGVLPSPATVTADLQLRVFQRREAG